jgi:hypothetical protein
MRSWLARLRTYLANPRVQSDGLSTGIRVALVVWAIHDPANLGRNLALACFLGVPIGGAILSVVTERRSTLRPKD